jgi:hypothetical protein
MSLNVFDVTFPPDTQAANQLGLDIRTFKTDIQARMALISGTIGNRWNPGADAQPANWTGILYFATDTNQLFQWSGSAWVQIAFSGTLVVASVNLGGQNAAIAATTLYAVPASAGGLYRASVKLTLTTVGTGGIIIPKLNWTNSAGAVASNSPGVAANAAVASEADMLMQGSGITISTCGATMDVAPSTNIQYSVVFSGVTGTPVYNLKARLEFLG